MAQKFANSHKFKSVAKSSLILSKHPTSGKAKKSKSPEVLWVFDNKGENPCLRIEFIEITNIAPPCSCE